MPITKQAIKRAKQNIKRHQRNRHYSSRMKSMIKLVLQYIKSKDFNKANKIFPEAISSIDTAAKKRIIHKNNAAHKKSKVQRAFNTIATKEKVVKKEADTKKVSSAKKK